MAKSVGGLFSWCLKLNEKPWVGIRRNRQRMQMSTLWMALHSVWLRYGLGSTVRWLCIIHDQIQGKDNRWQRHIHGQIIVVRLIINLHKNWIIII